jgi:NADH-quinone oxidoreductase subunit N
MTQSDFVHLIPYLVLAGGIVFLLLVFSFWRSIALAVLTTCAVLLASLVFIGIGGLDAAPHLIGSFMIIDGYGQFMSALFLLGALVTAVFAHTYLKGRSGESEEFYLLLMMATLGAMTVAAAQHFAAFFLGLELLSISLYVLIAYSEKGHPPLEAALKYLVLSGVASTTMLFGIALIYNATGTLVIGELAGPDLSAPRAELYLSVGQALLFAGLAFKLSLVPFHMWTPDVYQGAPAPVTGYLATVSKGAAFAFLLRYALVTDFLDDQAIVKIIGLVAVLSMIGGNVLALLQDNVKRILAYSSIAHVGYLLIGLLAIAQLTDALVAVEASLVYLAGYFLMTLAAFGVITLLSDPDEEIDAESIDAFVGLFWRRPALAAVMTVAVLSLTGIPLTVGFIVKFYLLTAGVEGGMWMLLWALVIGSAIAVYYYLRIVFAMVRSPDDAQYAQSRPTFDSMAALGVVGISLLVFGVYPSPLIDVVRGMVKNVLAISS